MKCRFLKDTLYCCPFRDDIQNEKESNAAVCVSVCAVWAFEHDLEREKARNGAGEKGRGVKRKTGWIKSGQLKKGEEFPNQYTNSFQQTLLTFSQLECFQTAQDEAQRLQIRFDECTSPLISTMAAKQMHRDVTNNIRYSAIWKCTIQLLILMQQQIFSAPHFPKGYRSTYCDRKQLEPEMMHVTYCMVYLVLY